MTQLKETNEALEDLHHIPEDASDDERERLRAKNARIRERNRQRIAEAQTVGRLTTMEEMRGQ